MCLFLSKITKKKIFGSPLKKARNSEDIVDRGDQPRETSLAPGQFLVITWEVYGRYGMALDTTIDSRMPQLARVIRHIIKGMKLLPPDPTQDSPTGFRFIWKSYFNASAPIKESPLQR